MWKSLRVTALLLVLATVAWQARIDRTTTTDWDSPLWIGLFPVNGDGSAAAADYIAQLPATAFAPLESFFAREARRHGVTLAEPTHLRLYPAVAQLPPALPRGAGALGAAWWSLKMRWYTWRETRALPGPAPQVRVFVLFHDTATSPVVPHSLGLQKGLLGVVYAFASRDMRGQNAIVVAHEILHTLGATDKYDPGTLDPLYPDGYGDPQQEPRLPQRTAEIMAGRRAIAPGRAELPENLDDVVVGSATAREIGWHKP
jgi:hypothetical protein